VPKAWTTNKEEVKETVSKVKAGEDAETIEGFREAFTDGSGDSNDVRTRRCGWGYAWLDSHDNSRGGAFGCLGEEKHTVAKAELQAVIALLKNEDWSGGLRVWTDCEYVSKGFKSERWKVSGPIPHARRWRMLGLLVQGKEHLLEVEWTKAHVDVELQEKLQYEQTRLSGNDAADALAKRGVRWRRWTLTRWQR
jgi:ribonuclease HI